MISIHVYHKERSKVKGDIDMNQKVLSGYGDI